MTLAARGSRLRPGVLRVLLVMRRAGLVLAALVSGVVGLVLLLGVVTPEGVGAVSTLQLGLVAALLVMPVVTAVAWRADRAWAAVDADEAPAARDDVEVGRGRGDRPAHRRRRGARQHREELRQAG